jgi:hypothetical protein
LIKGLLWIIISIGSYGAKRMSRELIYFRVTEH